MTPDSKRIQMDSESNQIGKRYFLFLIIFLGALSAFGPFITDFYLPTLPSMTSVFNTSESMVQLGLTTSLVGIAIGQVFFGPISDKYGRKHIMIMSLILFVAATLGCIWSPTIEVFNVFRFLQGLGGSGSIVMSRSVATDCYRGRELAKILAIVGAINGVAPVVAPVTGGLVSRSIGWQGIFWILFAIGVVLLGYVLIIQGVAEDGGSGNVSGVEDSGRISPHIEDSGFPSLRVDIFVCLRSIIRIYLVCLLYSAGAFRLFRTSVLCHVCGQRHRYRYRFGTRHAIPENGECRLIQHGRHDYVCNHASCDGFYG